MISSGSCSSSCCVSPSRFNVSSFTFWIWLIWVLACLGHLQQLVVDWLGVLNVFLSRMVSTSIWDTQLPHSCWFCSFLAFRKVACIWSQIRWLRKNHVISFILQIKHGSSVGASSVGVWVSLDCSEAVSNNVSIHFYIPFSLLCVIFYVVAFLLYYFFNDSGILLRVDR